MNAQPTLFSMTPLKPTSTARISSSLKEKAILVDFDGGHWDWTRRDRTVESEVATNHNVSKATGRYLKNLFLSTDQPLVDLRTVIASARESHRGMTLPWAPSRNLLLNKNVIEYKRVQLHHLADLDKAKAALSQSWPSMLSKAARALGPLFNPSDYPALDLVLDAAYLRHKFYPLADASDVRLSCDSDLVDEIRAQVKDDMTSTFNSAVLSSWERLLDILKNATTNLSKLDPKTDGRFRIEWHDNLSTLLPLLSGLNLDDDPRLDEMALRAKSLLRPDPEEYQTSLDARAKAYTKAQSIYNDLSAIYASKGGTK